MPHIRSAHRFVNSPPADSASWLYEVFKCKLCRKHWGKGGEDKHQLWSRPHRQARSLWWKKQGKSYAPLNINNNNGCSLERVSNNYLGVHITEGLILAQHTDPELFHLRPFGECQVSPQTGGGMSSPAALKATTVCQQLVNKLWTVDRSTCGCLLPCLSLFHKAAAVGIFTMAAGSRNRALHTHCWPAVATDVMSMVQADAPLKWWLGPVCHLVSDRRGLSYVKAQWQLVFPFIHTKGQKF